MGRFSFVDLPRLFTIVVAIVAFFLFVLPAEAGLSLMPLEGTPSATTGSTGSFTVCDTAPTFVIEDGRQKMVWPTTGCSGVSYDKNNAADVAEVAAKYQIGACHELTISGFKAVAGDKYTYQSCFYSTIKVPQQTTDESVMSTGLVPCGGTGQQPCQTCDVINLTNNVIGWLVAILGTIAALIICYAGIKLVTAGGNQHAMEEAKGMMTNILIGYTIVLAGWLLIDYGLKALLAPDAKFGTWNAIQCVEQPKVDDYTAWVNTGISNGGFTDTSCDIGPSGDHTLCETQTAACTGRGGVPRTEKITGTPNLTVRCTYPGTGGVVCDIGPNGDRVLCANQIAACTGRGGVPDIDDDTDPRNFTVRCAVSGGGGGGSCTVVADPNNACYPNKLGCFGNTNAASQICNLESRGGDTQVMSGSDLCKDGRSFSGGLWQINILANYSMVPGCNSSFFTKSGSWKGRETQGACLDPQTNRYGIEYCAMFNCQIVNIPLYDSCIAQIKNPAANTQIACDLYSAAGGWGPWQTSAKSCGVMR